MDLWLPLIGLYLLGVIGFWSIADSAARWFKLCLSLAWMVIVPVLGACWAVEEVWTWLKGDEEKANG